MANVADLNLIQINNFPEVENPSEWIVVSDAEGTAYKISKENFKAFLGTVTVSTPKPIEPSDVTPELDGVYIPTVVGVYPNFGGLERLESDGYVQFIKNGAVYAKINTPMPMQDISDLATKDEAKFNEFTIDYTLEQGTIYADGTPSSPVDVPGTTTRVRTGFIEGAEAVQIDIDSAFKTNISQFDKNQTHISNTGYQNGIRTVILDPLCRFFRVVIARIDDSPITYDTDMGLSIIIKSEKLSIYQVTVDRESLGLASKEDASFNKVDILSPDMEQGSILNTGSYVDRSDRIRTVDFVQGISSELTLHTNEGFKSNVVSFNTSGGVITTSGFRTGTWKYELPEGTVNSKVLIGKNDDTNLTPSEYTGLAISFNSAKASIYDLAAFDPGSGVPPGGNPGDVLTPEGWDENYAKKAFVTQMVESYLEGYATSSQVADILVDYVTKMELSGTFNGYATIGNLTDAVSSLMSKTDPVANLANGAVTAAALSQEVIDLLATAGATINNAADGEDLESIGGLIKIKGEGVVRMRVQSTPDQNHTQLQSLKTQGIVQIKDTIDLSNSDGSVRSVNLDGAILKFVGNGRLKNCRITGKVTIIADRTQIFENVHFGRWRSGSAYLDSGDNVYEHKAQGSLNIYRYDTRTLSTVGAGDLVNPFYSNVTVLPIGSFFSPVLEGGKYVYKENGSTLLTFSDGDTPGTVRLPIIGEYVFVNNATGEVVESTINLKTKETTYVDVPVANLRVSRLAFYVFDQSGYMKSEIFPEWFGANENTADCSEGLQNMTLLSGTFRFAPNTTYSAAGDIRIYSDNQVWHVNRATLRTIDNTTKTNVINFEWRREVTGNTIYDLIVDGNKNNQIIEQDGIFVDFRRKQYPFSGYSMSNTYWYGITTRNCSGSGIFAATPGISHIYALYSHGNKVDGLRFFNEHFTMTNVHCRDNGRHGAWAGGNHWRLVGGAFSHNQAGNSLHMEGAFESQIIGCSTIHSGQFVEQAGGGYIASPLNVYGYIYAGVGQGTHALLGGHGFYFENSSDITMVAIRINNQNADGIHVGANCRRLLLNSSLLLANNMTRGPWAQLSDPSKAVRIIASTIGSTFINSSDLTPLNWLGTQASPGDWDDLKATLGDKFNFGVIHVRDSNSLAINRPAEAPEHLFGTIMIGDGVSSTIGRTCIEMTGSNGSKFFRWVDINMATGAYTNDSGWKKVAYADTV